MHGFFGSYGQSIPFDVSQWSSTHIIRQWSYSTCSLQQCTLPQFLTDKWFHDCPDFFIAIEGVLFDAPSPEHIWQHFTQQGITCITQLRGSFSGFLYDKKAEVAYLFNDQVGSHMLFYTSSANDTTLFASDFLSLVPWVKKELCPLAMYSMLSYGFCPTYHTILKDIRRIGAGQCLIIDKHGSKCIEYFRFEHKPIKRKKENELAQLDILFRQAIQRVIDKNESEHLSHFFPLSGGLDSRMSVWVAHLLATQPIRTFTYSQTGFYDHLVPQEINQTLSIEGQFIPLNNGAYMKHIEKSTRWGDLQINFSGGVAVILDLFQKYQWENLGVILTGINGDSIFSTDIRDNEKNFSFIYNTLSGYTYKELQDLLPSAYLSSYQDKEIYTLYTRGFNCNSLGSPLALQHFTETYSPFCDVDVLQYVLTIPSKRRMNYRLYDKWILRYYPDAAQWLHEGERIGHRQSMIHLCGRTIPIKDIFKRISWYILKHLHIKDCYQSLVGQSMCPEDSWLKQNKGIAQAWNQYYEEHIQLLNNYSTLKKQAQQQYKTGNANAKATVLTLLAALQIIKNNHTS